MNHKYTNDLIHESSPYLLQHAHNPVNWQGWHTEVLHKAKEEQKLLLISIGYAACHWCHVMEHESFEDEEVAAFMNAHFTCIKVDREERPDVDQVYMNAAQLLTGKGGWPLNALAIPNGKPFFAGTYFPKENWLAMLKYYVDMWQREPQSIIDHSEKVTQAIQRSEHVQRQEQHTPVGMQEVDKQFETWHTSLDYQLGGASAAPKFPMPSIWLYLLHYHHHTKNEKAIRAVYTTLNHMADGGIYDHLQGGFARYATDNHWLVPHFEKMLYDNAQLVRLYAYAFQQSKNEQYADVVRECVAFVEAELLGAAGNFFSALDADSEGEEGKYYVWEYAEVQTILGADAAVIADYFEVKAPGNWEEKKNILHRKKAAATIAEKHQLSLIALHKKVADAKATLLHHRQLRTKPLLDDKSLTAWNALMICGYVAAYEALCEPAYLHRALQAATFIYNKLRTEDGGLHRNYKNGVANIMAMLDDYAFTIAAFIDLYQVNFEEAWLQKAMALTQYTLKHFYEEGTGMFYYTHQHADALIARKMELSDNVIPSSNSQMAINLLKLSHYFQEESFEEKARQMYQNVQKDIRNHTRFYAQWAQLELLLLHPVKQVAIMGKDAVVVRTEFGKHYLPHVLFMGGKDEGMLPLLKGKSSGDATMIYVCEGKTCHMPTSSVEVALQMIL